VSPKLARMRSFSCSFGWNSSFTVIAMFYFLAHEMMARCDVDGRAGTRECILP
jgi:hypothetical protein